jgi:hypothetical protein
MRRNRKMKISSLLCKFFGHKFGVWEYVTDNPSEQVRVCKRDGYEERRTLHQFGGWGYTKETEVDEPEEGGPYMYEDEHEWLGSDINNRR